MLKCQSKQKLWQLPIFLKPYKKGKTLSQAMRILGFMKNDAHIDAELFDVFVKEKIYLKYAEGFLDPEQIDEVKD